MSAEASATGTDGRPLINLREVEVEIYPDGTLNPRNAALYLGFSKATIDQWRRYKYGPRFIKCMGKVFYRRRDLDAWKEAQK